MVYIASNDVTTLQVKLYQHSNEFNNFENIDQRDIEIIRFFVEYFKEICVSDLVSRNRLFPKLDYYCQVLKFIFSAFNKNVADSYDTQILFLIFAFDPELSMYRNFLKHMPTLDKPLQYFIKDNNGIYDAKLIEYEKIFFETFIADKKLMTDIGDIGRKQAKILLKNIPLVKDFLSVSDEDFKRLQQSAEMWFLETDGYQNYKTAAFNITKQSELLSIKNVYEKLVFFVLTVDPEMHMLKIFEEESKIEDIKARAIEEFGFYNENFIKLERLYKERFFPNKKVSEWTFI